MSINETGNSDTLVPAASGARPARSRHEVGAPGEPPKHFLEVRDLKIHFPTDDGLVKSVDGLSFALDRGQTLGIVGESGSGKSVTSLGILGIHKGSAAQMSGEIWLDGQELMGLGDEQMRPLRGRKVAMVFQDSLAALNPYYTVGQQIAEAYRVHNDVSKSLARKRAVEMLDRVGIPQPDSRVDSFPHEFSGGMRQRAMIAMSLVCNPELLIADEPTTALDVTVQAQILDLMKDLQKEFGSAIIIITHDLGVVAEVADDILVMYGGRAVEYGTVREVLYEPEHPYAWGLLSSIPRLTGDVDKPLRPIEGLPPSLINVPTGCPFHPRCAYASRVPGRKCIDERPLLLPVTGTDHRVACHLPEAERHEVFATEVRPLLT